MRAINPQDATVEPDLTQQIDGSGRRQYPDDHDIRLGVLVQLNVDLVQTPQMYIRLSRTSHKANGSGR